MVQLADHELKNLNEIVLAERIKNDHFVKAVQELGIESALDFVSHQVFDLIGDHVFLGRLEAQAFALLQVPRTDIRRHDDDGVLEVHRVAQPVGEVAVFKDL